MSKKIKKMVIDERQEKELLKSESKGFWLGYWLLLVVMLAQVVLSSIDMGEFIPPFAGEWIVFMVMCVYIICKSMKNNVWERKREPSTKSNVVYSLVAGGVTGILMFVVAFINSGKPVGAIAAGVFIAGATFAMCFAALSVAAAVYESKKKKLEEAEENAQDEE